MTFDGLLGAIRRPIRLSCLALLQASVMLAMSAPVALAQEARVDSRSSAEADNGPIRLRQPSAAAGNDARDGLPARERSTAPGTTRARPGETSALDTRPGEPRSQVPAPQRGEFESFVRRLAAPAEVRRLGADIITEAVDRAAADFSPLVPADYIIKPGDEVLLTIWGSVDADLRLVVDRSGRINIPRVGPVQVAGVRYAELNDAISRRVGQQFRNYQLSATLGQLRGVRVYVTGFVAQPGAYSVSSLSTLTHALLAAGGPSASGSFRSIELRRGGKVETRFDLYDFLLNGERTGDHIVAADDVIYVGPVGPQVALIGSVNRPAIFELKPGETVADVLRMAGGFNTVADRSRLAVERLEERSSQRVTQIELPASESVAARNGDVLRAFSAVDAALPVGRQTKLVRVEGEVLRPGDYLLPPGSGMSDALAVAGGLTPAAYVFGTEFNRESVRVTQQQNYERALRDLEVAFSKSANTQRVSSADEAAAAGARNQSIQRLVDRLRELKPSGRVVLQIDPAAPKLPELALEDGDRIFVPPMATSVGVFGSVYNAGSYLWKQGATANDFLQLAGGPTVGADAQSVFLIRPNGSVVSARQNGSWISGRDLKGVTALPGDTIFVPDELDRTTLTQDFKDWSQILYQVGISAAAFVAVGK